MSKSELARMTEQCPYLFVYGILKRNEVLNLSEQGAQFIREATANDVQLYHIGSGVGARMEADKVAHGEVFEIPSDLWHWLDRIESNGFAYTRRIITVYLAGFKPKDAWIYFHSYPGMVYENPVEGNAWHSGM